MNKVRRKFVLYAELTVLVLLTVLMAVINIINFTMVSEDADMITERLSEQSIERYTHSPDYPKKDDEEGGEQTPSDMPSEKPSTKPSEKPSENTTSSAAGGRGGRFGDAMGRMGPDSPETYSSMRYFTVAVDKQGNAKTISYNISAISETDAQELAKTLIAQGGTGWTSWTYRYRVEKHDGIRYVTVIDQGRELLPSYRLLMISVGGELVVMILSFIILRFVGKWLFKPLQEADRKQQLFIRRVETDFRMPLTVINANTEMLERDGGANEQTAAIDRQVRKMTKLVKNLSSLSIYEEMELRVSKLNLSDLILAALDRKKKKFAENGLELTVDIDPDIFIEADEQALKAALSELIENSLKFAEGTVSFSLKKQGDRVTLIQKNPASLPNGTADQVFDRFTRLDNAGDKEGAGLGLSHVKDVMKLCSGRVGAKVVSGEFILRIDL